VNSTIGITVDTSAITAAHMTPSPLACTPPVKSAASPKVTAAPVATLAANGTAGVLAEARSEPRMKTV
jgi:hypothetical protein